MSNIANATQLAAVEPFSRLAETSKLAEKVATGVFLIGDTVNDRGVMSQSVEKYRTRYADTFDVQLFRVMFSDGTHSFIFQTPKICQNMNISALSQ